MLVELSNALGGYLHNVFYNKLDFWLVLGLFAQALFTARAHVQVVGEQAGNGDADSVRFLGIRRSGNGVCCSLYTLVRADLVYIIGQGSGLP